MSRSRGAGSAADAVSAVAEQVFGTVRIVHDDMLRLHEEATAGHGRLTGRDISGLRPGIRTHLRQQGALLSGLGVVVAPGLLPDEQLRLEWWQSEPGVAEPFALDVDLDPLSLGFYDYAAAEWFAVPRRTHGRHVVGPYVDVHGTGRYVLTFTMAVEADGQFLGVAGADVPASSLEARLLDLIGPGTEVVVLNTDRRVVLSTAARWLTGARVDAAVGDGQPAWQELPGLPWLSRDPGIPKPLTS